MWPARIRAKPDAVKEDADKSFEAFVETLALDEKTLQLGHGETIVPEGLATATDATDALATLPRLGTGQAPATKTIPHGFLKKSIRKRMKSSSRSGLLRNI